MYCISQSEEKYTTRKNYRLMFYNVENLFDYYHDSSLVYNDFTPLGKLNWTKNKYIRKRNNLYKVIRAAGGWDGIAILGLAEIENEFVITDLLNSTPLSKLGYRFIHFDSKDHRGIDVALVYDPDCFELISSHAVHITDPLSPEFKTRDMLYAKGVIGGEIVHIIVVHWTSRYRGLMKSAPLRMFSSNVLKFFCDSICSIDKSSSIIVMGDFNDNPENESMTNLAYLSSCGLSNLPHLPVNGYVEGTLKYHENWYCFDQILVSDNMLKPENKINCDSVLRIFDADFLLERDSKYLGYKLFRTNIGFKYHGGISDHLPVFVDIEISNK